MNAPANPYFASRAVPRARIEHQKALERVVARLADTMPTIGLRNPKIGGEGDRWHFCNPGDWVISFHSGQLWLAYQLTGDVAFRNAAQARRPDFRYILEHRKVRDHDLGFQFSLHSVADWQMTGDREARAMALEAAGLLLARFREDGGYIQAWNPTGTVDRDRAAYVNGRMIADCIQNLALLYWAHRETAIEDFRIVADAHAETSRRYLVREDGTSFHTYLFDPASGAPLKGQTHQGYRDGSCWSRGQAWLLHGFAQCHATTGNAAYLETARALAAATERLMGDATVPVWDFSVPDNEPRPLDSSAGAIMSAGLYILAAALDGAEAQRWRRLADRLLDGLLDQCDLTTVPDAQGLLAHGAAHVRAGQTDAMLPYGDYYFMEALMRSLGHTRFFW